MRPCSLRVVKNLRPQKSHTSHLKPCSGLPIWQVFDRWETVEQCISPHEHIKNNNTFSLDISNPASFTVCVSGVHMQQKIFTALLCNLLGCVIPTTFSITLPLQVSSQESLHSAHALGLVCPFFYYCQHFILPVTLPSYAFSVARAELKWSITHTGGSRQVPYSCCLFKSLLSVPAAHMGSLVLTSW